MSAETKTMAALDQISELVKDGRCQWRLVVHWDGALNAFSVRLLDEMGQTYRGTMSRSLERAIATVHDRVQT